MLNRITIIGRLTRDPEQKVTGSGTAVTTFTLAVDRDFKQADGTKETDFIPIVTWRGLAETCGKFLHKGNLCAVSGRLQIRSYEDKDGNKRTVAEVVADTAQFLTPKSESRQTPAEPIPTQEMSPLDEIPF